MAQKEEISKDLKDGSIAIRNMKDFSFNKCAEFCKIKDGFNVAIFESFYKDCCLKLPLFTTLKKGHGAGSTKYWFFAFKKHPKSPAFCKLEKFKEQRSGYFLAVTYKNYIALFCSNIIRPKEWNSVIEKIGYDDFVNFNVNKETEFKYLSMKNIDGSDYVVKKKSFEGNNLRKNVSSFASNKFFVQTMRGANKKKEQLKNEKPQSFSVNFGTAKFNQYESGLGIGKICEWVAEIIDEMNGSSKTDDSFLNNFAIRTFPTKDLEPSYILFNLGSLYKLFEESECEFSKKEKPLNKEDVEKELHLFDLSLPITREEKKFVAKIDDYVVNVKIEDKKISVSCKQWEQIVASSNEICVNLQEYINEEGLFNVYFESDCVVYSNGTYFRDSNLKEHIDWLLDYIIPCEDLNSRVYEKFKGRMKSRTLVDWPEKSEFKFVEEYFKDKYDVLLCDDYLEEWADYIGVKENCVEFIACKGNKHVSNSDGTKSASCFQEVIGQAIKNLGNFFPTDAQLETKKSYWEKLYLKSKSKHRIIQGDVDSGIELWKKARINPRYTKISSLVVNYITKDGFRESFKAMQTGLESVKTDSVEPSFQQLMLISNFVHSCIDMGVVPRIYCPEKLERDEEDKKMVEKAKKPQKTKKVKPKKKTKKK